MIAVDTLVHNFLHRTGILRRLGTNHPYGTACYAPAGCAEILESIAAKLMPAASTQPSRPTSPGSCSTRSGLSVHRAGSTNATAGKSMIANAVLAPNAWFSDCATAYPCNQQRICKMTDTSANSRRLRHRWRGQAARLALRRTRCRARHQSCRAAGVPTAWVKDETGLAIAEALPNGCVFARGNGFVRLVRQSAFDKLSAAVDGAVATTPEKEEV